MIISEILNRKKDILINGETLTDLIHSTFVFPSAKSQGYIVVGDFEQMRADQLCNRIYADSSKWDVLLKYNGISNPFSIKKGDVLYAIQYSGIDSAFKQPSMINEPTQNLVKKVVNKIDSKDSNRTDNLNKKRLPPNVNKPGSSNIVKAGGKITLGSGITDKSKCDVPISRAKLQKALIKDKLFI